MSGDNDLDLVSVVMNVKDGAPFIADAISSIQAQVDCRWEMIVVDDGSTDDTADVVESFEDPRIRLVRLPINVGIPAAINEGLREVAGAFVARLDADDLAAPDRLSVQRDYLKAHPEVSLVGGRLLTFGSSGVNGVLRMPVGEQLGRLLLRGNVIKSSAAMFRAGDVMKHSLRYREEYPNAQDYDFWTQLAEVGEVTNLDRVIGWYRLHERQQSSAYRMRQFRLGLRVQRKFLLSAHAGRFGVFDQFLGWVYLLRHATMYVVRLGAGRLRMKRA